MCYRDNDSTAPASCAETLVGQLAKKVTSEVPSLWREAASQDTPPLGSISGRYDETQSLALIGRIGIYEMSGGAKLAELFCYKPSPNERGS